MSKVYVLAALNKARMLLVKNDERHAATVISRMMKRYMKLPEDRVLEDLERYMLPVYLDNSLTGE